MVEITKQENLQRALDQGTISQSAYESALAELQEKGRTEIVLGPRKKNPEREFRNALKALIYILAALVGFVGVLTVAFADVGDDLGRAIGFSGIVSALLLAALASILAAIDDLRETMVSIANRTKN